MANNNPRQLEELKHANRQVRAAVRDCDELLERTAFMLSREDNKEREEPRR
jgi:hypothetical protein